MKHWGNVYIKPLLSLIFLLTAAHEVVIAEVQGLFLNDTHVLSGIRSVNVELGTIDPDAVRDGLRREEIRAFVEAKLRGIGIKILTDEQRFTTPGSPRLLVRIRAAKEVQSD